METANQETGAADLSISQAASKISDLSKPKTEKKPTEKPDKPSKPKVEAKPEPAEPEQEIEAIETQESESSEEQPTEATEQPEETSFERLDEIAEALGMPVEKFLQSIKGKVKVSGQERDVTLEEALKGYQLESDYRQKTMELSDHRKAFEVERDKQLNDVKARLGEAQHIAKFYEQQLMGEYNSINWQELRQSNPAEYAALQQDYNQRYQQLQQAKQQVAYEQQRLQYEETQKSQQAFQKSITEQREKLAEVIPEFRDPAKAKALKEEMRGFLKVNGFKDEEIEQVYDHRHVLLIRDAMKYRGLQDKSPQIVNKVKDAPKLLKPGAKPQFSKQTQLLKDARSRLRKSGNLKDAAQAIKHLIPSR